MSTITTLKTANEITGGLADTSKMPCDSWSISAFDCKRGSVLAKIPGSTCSGCYATKNRYVWTPNQNALNRRHGAFNNPRWIDAMVFSVGRQRSGYFRWFDSGDLQSVDMLRAIAEVARRTPDIRHWLPTRERGVIRKFLRTDTFPANLTVRVSMDMVDDTPATTLPGVALSNVVSDKNDPRWSGIHLCPVNKDRPSCDANGGCRACWDPKTTIGYPFH